MSIIVRIIPYENGNSGYIIFFDFCDEIWRDQIIYNLLVNHNAVFCLYFFEGRGSPEIAIADVVSIRLHGIDGPCQGE